MIEFCKIGTGKAADGIEVNQSLHKKLSETSKISSKILSNQIENDYLEDDYRYSWCESSPRLDAFQKETLYNCLSKSISHNNNAKSAHSLREIARALARSSRRGDNSEAQPWKYRMPQNIAVVNKIDLRNCSFIE